MSRPVTTEWRKTWVFAAQTELRQADLPGNLPRLLIWSKIYAAIFRFLFHFPADSQTP